MTDRSTQHPPYPAAPEGSDREISVADLCASTLTWLSDEQASPRRSREARALVRNHITPLIGQRSVQDIRPADIIEFCQAVAGGKTAGAVSQSPPPSGDRPVRDPVVGRIKGGQQVAKRCLALLATVFDRAEALGYRQPGTNPAAGLNAVAGSQPITLLDNEVRRILAAMNRMEEEGTPGMQPYVALFRLIHLTGLHLEQLRSLQWSMVDGDATTLSLPCPAGTATYPLPGAATAELKSLQAVPGNPYVFADDEQAGQPVSEAEGRWVQICAAAGLRPLPLARWPVTPCPGSDGA